MARFIAKSLASPKERRAEHASKHEGGHKALRVMEQQLQKTPYLTGTQPTTADIALSAYSRVAGERGFDLMRY